jgi:hypothetical protein
MERGLPLRMRILISPISVVSCISGRLLHLQFVLANATDLQSVTVSFSLYLIEEEDSRMCYFLHTLLGDGTWTACEDEDFDKPYECSKLYKWTPSP